MATVYTPKQVTEIAGISLASVRNYTDRYRSWYSAQATPPPGEARLFTEVDLLLTCYIAQTTQAGSNHSEIAAHLEKSGGVPSDFADSWELPAHQSDTAQGQGQEEGVEAQAGALVPGDQARALWAMVEQQVAQAQALAEKERARADRLQEEGLEKERALLAQLAEKERAIGELTGELRAVKEQRRGWLDRLLGRFQAQDG